MPARTVVICALLLGPAGASSCGPAALGAEDPAPPEPSVVDVQTRAAAATTLPTPAPVPVEPPPTIATAPTTSDDCVASVDALPEVGWLDRDDARLQRDDLVVVIKSARRLAVFDRGARTHCFRVALGFAPEGHKQVQGDGKTPEGWYRTSDKPWSSFDHAIAIHYPNVADARAARADGRIGRRTHDAIVDAIADRKVPPQSTALGGAVLIHGGGSRADWTLGCVALDDADLLRLRDALPRGMRTDLLVLP